MLTFSFFVHLPTISNYPFLQLTYAVLIGFTVCANVVLLNLLIGLMTTTLTRIPSPLSSPSFKGHSMYGPRPSPCATRPRPEDPGPDRFETTKKAVDEATWALMADQAYAVETAGFSNLNKRRDDTTISAEGPDFFRLPSVMLNKSDRLGKNYMARGGCSML